MHQVTRNATAQPNTTSPARWRATSAPLILECSTTPEAMMRAAVAGASRQLDDDLTTYVQTRTVAVSASGNTHIAGPARSKNRSPVVQPMTVLTIRALSVSKAVCICGSVTTITEMTAHTAVASPTLRRRSHTAVVPMPILTA